MIRFERVTVTYPDAPVPALSDVSLHIPEGELCLVVGPTGSGKSTLLRCVNGLVPWFSGGEVAGRVVVDGRDTSAHPPRELADIVGYVGQAPASGFVAEMVEDELAYTMENLGVAPDVMRRRVEEVIDALGLGPVRRRALTDLSSGEQQRVAIGSVLAAAPRVLVLDEPTSALDPAAAEEVLASLTRLVHDLGLTVVVAEHRLERVIQYADRVVVIERGRVRDGSPEAMMTGAPVAPPVVELGRLAGWSPLPLSVRDARRQSHALRDRLGRLPLEPARIPLVASPVEVPVVEVRGLCARYGTTVALGSVDLAIHRGEIVAVMGRNGAGKSTLLAQLAGLRVPAAGRVTVGGAEPHTVAPAELVRMVALVPSDPGVLLYAASVADECRIADEESGLAPGTTMASVTSVLTGVDPHRHPRDLSEGQRLALTLGIVLAPEPDVVLLDEPTRGLDYAAKRELATVLRSLAARDHAIVLATHDVEMVAEIATRVVVLGDGDVVASGPAREVVSASPMFAPQVGKILAPSPWLTVGEVREALGA